LWTAVAGAFTVFGVRLSREATLLDEWLQPGFPRWTSRETFPTQFGQ